MFTPRGAFCAGLLLVLTSYGASASPVSPLFARGYAVIPEPQKVELKSRDFQLDSQWGLRPGDGVNANDVSTETLKLQLEQRYHLSLAPGGQVSIIQLAVRPNSVQIEKTTDANRTAAQAYRLQLSPQRIQITANAPAGLFYGVETLVQLVKTEHGKFWLP